MTSSSVTLSPARDEYLPALRAAIARLRARGQTISPLDYLEGGEPLAPRPEQPPPVSRHWLDELEDRHDQERDTDQEGQP